MNRFKKVYIPPTLSSDWYKQAHRKMYPEGTTRCYSTWIPRDSRIEGINAAVAVGLQMFIKDFLMSDFQDLFFDKPVDVVCTEWARYPRNCLGEEAPDESHWRWLHKLGYLPLEIRALPEGTLTPLRIPMFTIENTLPEAFWLVNFIESVMSSEIWRCSTSATIARQYRKMLNEWCEITGGDSEFVQFQGHDFSYRGMGGQIDAAKSGVGHLCSFVGTDTIPAIWYAEAFYGADIEKELVGCSVPASEHSVECAYGEPGKGDYEYIRRLVTECHPSGIVSCVSDGYDLWNVLTDVLPSLKSEIMARDGKTVVRPDSGNPVDILCGTFHGLRDKNSLTKRTPEEKGVIELLWDAFGGTLNNKGFKVLDPHVGAIYGDSITLDRADEICARLADKGFASTNVVFGIGSFTYCYVTRDTFGFALKSTWVEVGGLEKQIFKDPITDVKKIKKSLRGRCTITNADGHFAVTDGLGLEEWQLALGDQLMPIYKDGELLVDQNFADIRARVLDNL